MPLTRTHVEYVLTQFEAGVSPQQILIGLQYRAFLPSINLATIERCLRENGRLPENCRPDSAAQGNQTPGAGGGRNPPLLVNGVTPDPSMTTEQAHQSPASPVAQTSATGNLVDLGPTTLEWDAQAERSAIAAYRSGQSIEEILLTLRSRGYDIAQAELIVSLVRQEESIPIAR